MVIGGGKVEISNMQLERCGEVEVSQHGRMQRCSEICYHCFSREDNLRGAGRERGNETSYEC